MLRQKTKPKSKNSNKYKIHKIFLIILITIVIIYIVFNLYKKFFYPLDYFKIVEEKSNSYGVDPYLILSIIKTESGFNNNVTSSKGAKGLMQIKDSTAIEIHEEEDIDLYDEETNIEVGIKYFSYLIERYSGNYYLAICAYNAGLGNVDKWIEEGKIGSKLDSYNITLPFKETQNYLKKVMINYNMYKVLYKF